MAYPEVLIPPSVKPESPYEPQLLDEQTTPFVPRFGRGLTQRQVWGDPLLGVRLRYPSLAGADRALMRAAMLNVKGKGANVRWTPGMPLLGSFPATELLTNTEFSSTTGWTSGAAVTLSVSNRVMRATRNASSSTALMLIQTPTTVVQYAPHVCRAFISFGTFAQWYNSGYFDVSPGSISSSGIASFGMVTRAYVPLSTSDDFRVQDNAAEGPMAGDFALIQYASLSRCAMVDYGPNLNLYSDQLDNAAWTATSLSVSSNADVAPDGATTADRMIEASATAQHYLLRASTVSSAQQDFVIQGCFKSGTGRSFVELEMGRSGGSVRAWFDLGTGATGTISGDASWTSTLRRSYITSLGNGWYHCALVAFHTGSGTTLNAIYSVASADAVFSYLGNGTNYISAWRLSAAAGSLPTRLSQTTSASTTGTAPSGSTLYLKGLPASTAGLLKVGDWFEVNGELKQATSELDSNAAGLGSLSFRPGLWRTPADSAPVIVLNPMGRFMLAEDPRITEEFGVYTGYELNLVECSA